MTRYTFIHALYQDVLYGRLTAGKRSTTAPADRSASGGSHAEIKPAEVAVHG